MAQQQALSPTQLAWVRTPLSELLKQVRFALEIQDDDAGNANYSGALQHLKQLSATLRMLGIEGAAHAIEEMHELADDLAEGHVEDPEQEALGTLLGGTVVVDDYLDRLQIGQTDLPLVLLPLINDVRAARGKALLPEGAFFKADLAGELPPMPGLGEHIDERDLGRLRQLYQTALRNWLRQEKNETPLHRLMVICVALAKGAQESPEQRMWRIAMVTIYGFIAGHVHAGIGIKRLLVRLDLHLKRLLDGGTNRDALIEESDLLSRSLLFYLAMAEPGNASVQAVVDHYRLKEILPDRTILDQAWGSVRGRNREVFVSVAKGVLDELLNVKDVLDLQMRAAAIDPDAIGPLGDTLNNAANTLEMLNVGSAAELVRGESQRLHNLVQSPGDLNQEALIDVATSLLQVEAHIQRAADAMGEVEQEVRPSRMAMGGHEFGKVVGTLLSHTLDNMHLAQQQLEQWLSGSADSGAGNSILRLLEESSGAVQMLDLQNVSILLRRCAAFLRNEIVEASERADDERIAEFADALAAVEIYLTSKRDQQGERADLLQRADNKLTALGYETEPEAVQPAREAPAEPQAVTPPAAPSAPPLGAGLSLAEQAAEPAAPESEPTPAPAAGFDLDSLSVSSDFDLADTATEKPSATIDQSTVDSLQLADPDADWSAPAPESRQEPPAPPPTAEAPAAEVPVARQAEPAAPVSEEPAGQEPVAHEPAPADAVESAADQPVAEESATTDSDFDYDGMVAAAEMLAPETDRPAAETEAAESAATEPAAPAEVEMESAPVPDIDPEFLEIFLEEFDAEEETLAASIVRLADNPYDRALLTEMRRSFHTLKGSGRMVGAMEIGEFSWEIENLLNRVLDDQVSITKVVPIVQDAIGLLPGLKARLYGQAPAGTAARAQQVAQAAAFLSDPKKAQAAAAAEAAAEQEAAEEATAEGVADTAATAEETAAAEQAPVAEEVSAAEPATAAADAGAEAVDEDALDPTLADLIRTELAEHRGVLVSYLEDSDYRGWAEVPGEVVVRAIHTIAGNLGLAHWTGDTEALHTVERYLRELGAMRKPPNSEGIHLIREAISLTTQRLESLGNAERVADSAVEPGGLGRQAQSLLDQLYRQLESDLAKQSSADEASPDTGAAETPPAEEWQAEAPVAAAAPGDTSVPEVSELSDFDLEPFAAFSEAPATAEEDPWAESLRAETGAEATADEEGGLEVSEEWLSEEDFAALMGERGRAAQPAAADRDATEAPPAAADDAESLTTTPAEPVAEEPAVAEESATGMAEEPASAEAAEPAAEPEVTVEAAAGETVDSETGDTETVDEDQRAAAFVEQTAAQIAAMADLPAADEAPPQRTAAAPPAAVPATVVAVNYEDLDPDLLDIFLGESEEILESMDSALLAWREEHEPESLTELKRHLHTLKGGARMAGLDVIGELGHELETMLELSAPRGFEGADMDTIQHGCDELHAMLEAANQRLPIPTSSVLGGDAASMEDMPTAEEAAEGDMAAAAPTTAPPAADGEPAAVAGESPAPASAPRAAPRPAPAKAPAEAAEARPATSEVVRVNALLLDNLVNYAGEISIFRSRLEQEIGSIRTHVTEVEETVQRLREQLRKLELETEAQILSRFQREQGDPGHEFDPLELDRYSTIQQLSRALAESVNDLISLQEVLDTASSQSETLLLQQSRVNTELQEGLMQTRLVPFASLSPRLRRVVRRAASETGRQARVELDFKGGEGLLDRNVLERITAPLEHMLRNSVVHGIEAPEERARIGKEQEGLITIAVDREATELLIQVVDDGRGINAEKVRSRAEQLGLTTAQAQLSINEVLNFIFSSGFSTASELTELAGRGVGMDVVANEVRQLGGSIDIRTEVGKGTRFSIRIPLSLAVMQAIMVRAGDRIYAIPLTSVRGVAKMLAKDYLQAIDGTQPVFEYGGREYPILELEPQLGLEPLGVPDTSVPLLMIEAGEARAALRVAELQTHREVVVKPVGPQISSIPGILGGTITGDGQVVIILDMGPLIRRGLSESRLPGAQFEYLTEHLQEQKRTPLVLVVDDSITMRKVTSRVLEHRRLEVMTARDGLDAVEVMYERVPDLILLDIEMPRMDGYELATHVRNDARLRHIPMMIISSRTGEKHRQRGDEVGVDRYLGKPYRESELVKNVFELLEMDPPAD